jgi:hypothetical protein
MMMLSIVIESLAAGVDTSDIRLLQRSEVAAAVNVSQYFILAGRGRNWRARELMRG